MSGGIAATFTVTVSPVDQDWPVPLHTYSLAVPVVPSLNFSLLAVPPRSTSKKWVLSSASGKPPVRTTVSVPPSSTNPRIV